MASGGEGCFVAPLEEKFNDVANVKKKIKKQTYELIDKRPPSALGRVPFGDEEGEPVGEVLEAASEGGGEAVLGGGDTRPPEIELVI